ncbi:alpha-L-rhamnosidase [Sphingobium sp. AP50]|uniref:glycosyl hydrolase n=1 Tax=Sphingobium sp. AP50 TaxID=1884369 RepID=UPI0008B2B07C|nr:glycosyl hydrolase [Sphingobium sp. AP50]SEJ91345.1 alpha-L-rhamnosidase [Sphingobium sp. AP50]
MRKGTRKLGFVGAIALIASPGNARDVPAQSAETVKAGPDALLSDFQNPPSSARPRVWWHWMNGNVTKDGIDKDLSWLKGAGVGGVQNFDGSLDTPAVVDQRLPYMSSIWQDAFRHAVARAKADKLEFTIASSSGWSETGGPWVRPEQAMKKMVWSETIVERGRIEQPLPMPPSVTGLFQNVPGGGTEPSSDHRPVLPSLYRDAAVVAYRIPAAEQEGAMAITASSAIDAAALDDGDLTDAVELPFEDKDNVWIEASFERPQTLRALQIALEPGARVGPLLPPWPIGHIEASDDGKSYRTIAALPPRGNIQQTIAFPSTTAKHFRLVLERRFGPVAIATFDRPQEPPASLKVMEFKFISGARVNRFEDKAGFSPASGLQDFATPDYAAAEVISPHDVVNVSDKLRPDGTLDWVAPKGRWRIVRFGWSLTGKMNNPASPEGTGLEVDKLNARHVSEYTKTYLSNYQRALGQEKLGEAGIAAMLNDSYEALSANWTDDILDQFQTRRGYDPHPWLPVLAGYVVTNSQKSDAFLWDFRRTLSDLIADAHYGTLTNAVHALGMIRYGESHEGSRAFVGDGMEVKKTADVPMGATWAGDHGPQSRYLPDILESASVAHLYGQNIVAAESFTAVMPAYAFPPEVLKSTADSMMANGVNRFVIHTSVHQPIDRAGPGIGLGPFGQWFTRKETWAAMARPWVEYLGRSGFLLQQGRFAGDIAYFYGEDDNITAAFNGRQPIIPSGFAFDFVNGDALRSLLSTKDGVLSAPSGAQYQILVIDPAVQQITVPVLRKIASFVAGGGALVGVAPKTSPTMVDNRDEFDGLVKSIWSSRSIYPTIELAAIAHGITPDVIFERNASQLAFVHRSAANEDIYFISNPGGEAIETKISFRVEGKAAELWRAEDGSAEPLSYQMADGRTMVPLSLQPHDAVFVVFKGQSNEASRIVAPMRDVSRIALATPWKIEFPAAFGNGARSITSKALNSWSVSNDPAIRYFSGTARYQNSFMLPFDWKRRATRWILELGSVKNLAEIRINGCIAGTVWKAPFSIDISKCARAGRNVLEVRVANLWPNRLIGDAQPGFSGRPAFATFNPYKADSPLLPSGLLGPVELIGKK